MKQLELPGMPKMPRPEKTDPETIEEFKKIVLGKLNAYYPGEENEEIADYAVRQVAEYRVIDGYQLAKKLDNEYCLEGDVGLVEMLDDFDYDLDTAYWRIIKEWVISQCIEPHFKLGDKVRICLLKGEYIQGEVAEIYKDKARAVIYCESLGHVREGNGTHGTIKNYEEIELIDGDSE